MVAHYTAYYENQIGGGRIHNVFVGSPTQRGHGIGSFLGGLWRSVLPLLKKGAKAIGKEAVRTGLHVIEDVSGHQQPFKESLRRRVAESGDNLHRKANEKISLLMNGSGYNAVNTARTLQSLTGRTRARTTKKKRRVGISKKSHAVAKRRRRKTTAKISKKRGKGGKRVAGSRRTRKRKASDIFGNH